ncbi:putative regulator of Ras-like GTPase activity (Roadblock/LC7/MglB family) [Allocatelliglobosispora scoriae]|uniref:Putative regulator of Ras-like GTPase activity (Roadblock/LC7/MglB family) n=1 Tax=Allocatelliglobosispora scoriae TaxID=643052 RepID=A0A841C130_9ACTN|nr:roadblock/LC7 domain-containing protein [Allocatelliglobosispora scoriae]MBB5872762.1 putative regulator of Ras-like GTPase activity (Roadblock/LC7/MglB family) [Allocatelliglobosispora scoriae]
MPDNTPVLAELRRLRERLPYIAGIVVASTDGLLVAHEAPGIEPETVAAMSAALLGLSQQLAAGTGSGDFRETVTSASHGYVATFVAGESALLTVLAKPELNVGLLHHEARPAAARIGALLAEPSGARRP